MDNEIKKDFEGIHKNRSIKLSFLKKLTKSDLFVSKKTGCLIPGEIASSQSNLNIWNKRYSNKNYTSTSPHFASRHAYTIYQIKKKLNFENLCIADLGCGNAGLVSMIQKLTKKNLIYGFDDSSYNFKNNKKNYKKNNLRFVKSSIENIDKKKYRNFFDLIILTWTLSSCSQPLIIIDKIRDILKKDGILVISESSRVLVHPVYDLNYYFDTKSKINTFINYPWRFSFNSLNNLLIFKNFELIDKNDFKHNENMVLIFKKKKFVKKNYKFDNYKNVINFFKKWKVYSNKIKF